MCLKSPCVRDGKVPNNPGGFQRVPRIRGGSWALPYLVGMVGLDVPERTGGGLAEGAAGQVRLEGGHLIQNERLQLGWRLLDDDGGGRRGGAGNRCRQLRRGLLLHLHLHIIEVPFPLPLVRIGAIPAAMGERSGERINKAQPTG